MAKITIDFDDPSLLRVLKEMAKKKGVTLEKQLRTNLTQGLTIAAVVYNGGSVTAEKPNQYQITIDQNSFPIVRK